MARKNDKAGLMKQLKAKTINSSVNHQNCCPWRALLLSRTLRSGMMLCFVWLSLHSLGISVLGQDKWSKKVTIDVTKPLVPGEYRSGEKTPQDKTELEFKGNGQNWSLLTFDHIPENIRLKVNGPVDGYRDSEEIKAGHYYPFRTRLPLILEIKPDAGAPVELKYTLGSWATGPVQVKMQDPNSKVDDARKFADVADNVKPNVGPQTLNFAWGAPATVASPAPNASPKPTAPPLPTPEFSWVSYLFDENLGIGIAVVVIGLLVLVLLVVYGIPMVTALIGNSGRSRRREASRRIESRRSPLDIKEFQTDTDAPNDRERPASAHASDESKYPVKVYNANKDLARKNQWPDEEKPLRHDPGHTVLPPPKTSPATSFGRPAAFSKAAATSVDDSRLEEIEKELTGLKENLKERPDRHEQQRVLDAAISNLEGTVIDSKVKFEQQLKTAISQLESFGLDQASLIEKTRTELTKQVNETELRGVKANEQLVALLKGVLEDVRNVDTRLQARLTHLQTTLDEQTVPDSFFNKTLGAVLGQNVETLQDGNFERLIGEKLNRFFETGVERGENLQELRARAEGINSALKDVSVQMEKLNTQASVEARQPMQRVESFVNELSGLQSQMQSRRATIETTLHVPVSMHAGARQTFLDELGRGIKREIDKLNDPVSYFEGELERTITADLIAIVDICDKTVAPPPGSRPDLETALKQLFEQAGLRQILPHQNEPFKTAEQDLIEMAQGSGQSLTVAQVITRGFFYKHSDNETLLRKAGVSVYR